MMEAASHRFKSGRRPGSFDSLAGICASGLRKGLVLGAVATHLVLPASASTDETPFIPPRATVVIVVGLAGDVANERDYHTQLTELLDLLPNQVPPPGAVFVLGGQSETVGQIAPLPIKILGVTRGQFKALGKNLSELTD